MQSDKTPSKCLGMLIENLLDIQTFFPSMYWNKNMLRNKLLNSMRVVEDCQFAYHMPADTVWGATSAFHAFLETLKKHSTRLIPLQPAVAFVDHQFTRRNSLRQPAPSSTKNVLSADAPDVWLQTTLPRNGFSQTVRICQFDSLWYTLRAMKALMMRTSE